VTSLWCTASRAMIREEHFSILWPPLLRGLLILKVRRV